MHLNFNVASLSYRRSAAGRIISSDHRKLQKDGWVHQQRKNCSVTSCCHFRRRSEVKGFKHRRFGIKRELVDNKRNIKEIKPFALWDCLISWPVLCSSFELKQLCLSKKRRLIFFSILVWLTWLGGRVFDHHSTLVGTGGHLPTKISRWVRMHFDHFFKIPGLCPGEMLAAGTDLHIINDEYLPVKLLADVPWVPEATLLLNPAGQRPAKRVCLWYPGY